MQRASYKVIGLMSGTSLDGLDMAYCHFYLESQVWHVELKESKSISYSPAWEQKLRHTIDFDATQLLELDIEFGKFLGAQVQDFINENRLEVDFVASHGHTVFHQPQKGFTYQIGSGQEISIASGIKTICDFRKKDVAFGGQGAPLVPIGDKYLFGEYTACLNLGGIANISFEEDNKRVAFDIGLANMLLNYLANKKGKPFDISGNMARSGSVNQPLLEQLNALSYFELSYPKSLGYEWFLSDILPIIENSKISVEDKICTSVEHEAMQIAHVLKKDIAKAGEVLITGGGAFNTFMVERIKSHSPKQFKIVVPDPNLVDFKEAIIFAFMGVLKERGEVNCLKSVTGASQDVSGGEVFYPN